jgi:hypothetical protein
MHAQDNFQAHYILFQQAIGLLHIKKLDPSFDIEAFEDLEFLETRFLTRLYWKEFDLLFPEIPDIDLTLDI